MELFEFEMHPGDTNQAWISGAYTPVENLGQVKTRSMSIAPDQAIAMIQGKSNRRGSISAALLAGRGLKMSPSMNNDAIIEEEEEDEEDQLSSFSRKLSTISKKRSDASVGSSVVFK